MADRQNTDRQKNWLDHRDNAFSSIVFCAPLMAFFAPKGMIIIASLCFIFCFSLQRTNYTRPHPLPKIALVTLVLIFIWSAISSLWALDMTAAILGTLKQLGVHGLGLLLLWNILNISKNNTNRVLTALFAGLVFTTILIAAEIIFFGPIYQFTKGIPRSSINFESGSGLFWLNSVAAVVSVLIWPISLWFFSISKKFIAYIIPLLGFLLALWLSYRSGAVAIGIGILSAGFIALPSKRIRGILATLFAVMMITAPITMNQLKPSQVIEEESSLPKAALHRLMIWNFTAEKIREKPVFGWGMNAARNIPGGKNFIYDASNSKYGENLPLHPHNIALQVWLELGLAGALLITIFGFAILLSICKDKKYTFIASIAVGQFITGLGILSLSYGMWQSWWVASLYLSASLSVLVYRNKLMPKEQETWARTSSTNLS